MRLEWTLQFLLALALGITAHLSKSEKSTGTPRNVYQMCFDQCVQGAEPHSNPTSRNMLA